MIQGYRKILFATDFAECAPWVGERAVAEMQHHQASLSLLHIVDYLPIDPTGEGMLPTQAEIEPTLVDNAKQALCRLAKALELENAECIVEVGNPRTDITRFADEHGYDLIILGSHGRRGLDRLLGSTADAVLHHAHCDVLAVKIPGSKA